MDDDAGFTLVELLVVLAVLGLLVTLVPSFFPGSRAGVELTRTARAMADDLRVRRTTAVDSQAAAELRIDALLLPAGMTLAAEDVRGGDLSAIRFFPDGSSTGGRLTLSAAGRTRVVAVDWLSGQVRIHE